MENYIVIEGKKVELSEETVGNIKKALEKRELPQTWEDLKRVEGYWVAPNSKILMISDNTCEGHKNVWPTEELAEAEVAMSQLAQLRDRYNDGWKPDWRDENQRKYVIDFYMDEIDKNALAFNANRFLCFKTLELRNEFLNNFRDLIETAKPLL